MAGGDGSQALVASIAIEYGLPFVCVSAGTRNHFALDLGLDREDPRTSVAAFRDAHRTADRLRHGQRPVLRQQRVPRRLRHARPGGGLPRREDGDAATLLPELSADTPSPSTCSSPGPTASRSTAPSSSWSRTTPTCSGPALDISQRRSMETGTLGVVAVTARTGREAAALVARSTAGSGPRDPHIHQFTATSFEIRSRSGHGLRRGRRRVPRARQPAGVHDPPAGPPAARAGGEPRRRRTPGAHGFDPATSSTSRAAAHRPTTMGPRERRDRGTRQRPGVQRGRAALEEMSRLDRALYTAVAESETPTLDHGCGG